MHMTGYTKLFGSIVASTIWREDDKTRIVWITMLAIANKHGEVESSLPGLADLSRVSVDECRAAIVKLESPDIDSRSEEEEGRRIVKVPGGWRLVNHAKYRHKLSADERREYLTQKQRESRERRERVNNVSTNVNNGQQSSTLSTQADADSEAKAETEEKKKEPKASPSGFTIPECFAKVDGFTAALAGWIEARKKKRNPATGHAIQLLINRLAEQPGRAVAALNEAIERGWATVKWDWMDNLTFGQNGRPQAPAIAATGTATKSFPKLPGH